MEKAKLISIIKKRFGDTDEDLADLEVVMDAITENENYQTLKDEYEDYKKTSEVAYKDNDDAWRKRYRDRFFDGESAEDLLLDADKDEAEEVEEEYTMDDFLKELEKENF